MTIGPGLLSVIAIIVGIVLGLPGLIIGGGIVLSLMIIATVVIATIAYKKVGKSGLGKF
jgi:hypothetical protein